MERHHKGWGQSTWKVIVISTLIVMMTVFVLVSLFAPTLSDKESEDALANNSKCQSSHIVMEKFSHRVLWGDNIHARLPMASTTKIMTALVAIESGRLDEMVTITHEMEGIEGSSIYLHEGENLTIRELLYGLMLRSGNDTAVAIATQIGGSVEGFVGMMNKRAVDMELKNTHFVTPHGLHDDKHYTSAYDLAVISAIAMNNDTFREIVGTRSIVIGGETSDKRYLVNKNKMLALYEGANGIKTGYTKRAGRCLVSSSRRGNMEVISVVLNEPDMWNYSMNAMDRAYNEYHNVEIVRKDMKICDVDIDGNIVGICTHNTLYYPIREDEKDALSYRIEVDNKVHRIRNGENVGKIKVFNDKHLIFEEKIYTM